MQIIEQLELFSQPRQPLVLAIGNFDGFHRGHYAVLRHARLLAGQEGQIVVITFRNHPSEVLRPAQPTRLLCTLPHKLRLIEQFGIDTLILLSFTRYLAQHSAASFIERVRQSIPFSHLVLGHDATLGRDRQGNRPLMQQLAEEWGFQVHYLDEYRFEGQPVSSTRIRALLQRGDLEQVEILLDRPYSIYAPVSQGQGQGKLLGYPTANLETTGLCLPPFGVYAVEVRKEQEIWTGIANLGVAPTLKTEGIPLLEVHLFAPEQNLYDDSLEVIFKRFIRPEQKFSNLDELRRQIALDIETINR
jgi:riboflavin kinase/FMN adenylyltransferase